MEFIPLIIVGVLMYAVLILPQQRRNKQHKELLSSIEVGDEVVMNSGTYGFIAAIEDEVLWLEVAENVELKVSRSAVANKVVLKDPEPDDAEPKDAESEDAEDS